MTTLRRLLPLLFFATPARAETLGLKECVQFALQHAPTVVAARENTAVADLQTEQARAKRYPTVDVQASQGAQRTVPAVPPPPKTPLFGTMQLTAAETFWDFGQTATQIDIAAASAEAVRLTEAKARDDVAVAVAHAYYNLTQADLQVQIKRQQSELLDKQFRQLGNLYRQGLKSKKEFLRFQSQVERASLDQMSAESSLRTAQIALKRLLGVPEGDQTLKFATVTPAEALQAKVSFPAAAPTVATQFQVRINKLLDDAAAANVELARLRYGPQLALTGGLGYANPDYLGLEDRPWASDSVNWSVALGVTYNLYDAGSRRRDIQIAEGQRQAASAGYRDQTLQLAADIRTLMETLANLKASFDLTRQVMELEEENFKNLEADYRAGNVIYLDLVTGLTDLLTARVNFYTTYVQILDNLAQYRYYEGTLYASLASP